jgi:GNAT superfamily N-acetyltransferase
MIQSTFLEHLHVADFFYRTEVLGERDANSWYLVYLGTRPDARGKGYARKLVEYVTSQVPSPRFPRKNLILVIIIPFPVLRRGYPTLFV